MLVRSLGQAEHRAAIRIEPVGVVADAVLLLDFRVEPMCLGERFCGHAGRVVTVEVQRHALIVIRRTTSRGEWNARIGPSTVRRDCCRSDGRFRMAVMVTLTLKLDAATYQAAHGELMKAAKAAGLIF